MSRKAPRALLAAALAGLAVLGLLPPPASAQTYSCGEDLVLVFRNPDLAPQADGFIHASGRLFVQFQAIGLTAGDIATFAFSFGPQTADFDESACQYPVWFTGAYVLNYRADRDPSDGFFINLNTTLVPDGTYAAAVHAYDADHNELARFWAKAIVDNCDAQPTPVQERCGTDLAQVTAHDTTDPWPIVLPGDGQQVHSVGGLTIEFAEALSSLKVLLNGTDITAELQPFEGRVWDDDLIPGYGPAGLGAVIAPECSQQPPQQCNHWGPAYSWNVRELTNDDVIRVEATDLNNNTAVKDIHIGSAVAGGAVTDLEPNLQITVDALRKTTAPSVPVTFAFDMDNSGGGTAHPFTGGSAPEGWQMAWLPHEPIPPGESARQELTVTPPGDAVAGEYHVNATIAYPAAGEDRSNSYDLVVEIGGGPDVGGTGETGEAQGGGKSKGSPGPSPLLLLAALGALAAAGRRRR